MSGCVARVSVFNPHVVDCVTLCDAVGLSEGRRRGEVEKPACSFMSQHRTANLKHLLSFVFLFFRLHSDALPVSTRAGGSPHVRWRATDCHRCPHGFVLRVRVGGQENVHHRRFLQQIDDICEEGHRSRFVGAVGKSNVEP